MTIVILIYMALSYCATGRIIYADRILSYLQHFVCTKSVKGFLFEIIVNVESKYFCPEFYCLKG